MMNEAGSRSGGHPSRRKLLKLVIKLRGRIAPVELELLYGPQ